MIRKRRIPPAPKRPPVSSKRPAWFTWRSLIRVESGFTFVGVVVAVAVALSVSHQGGAKSAEPVSTVTRDGAVYATRDVVNPASLPGMQTGGAPFYLQRGTLSGRLDKLGFPYTGMEGAAEHIHQHLDIWIEGHKLTVPAGIGINPQPIFSPIHTHDATGIVHVESPKLYPFTLGQFFDVGVSFDAHRLGGYRTGHGRTLRVYENGRQVSGDPRLLVLEPYMEISIVYGSASEQPAHIPARYAFPDGY